MTLPFTGKTLSSITFWKEDRLTYDHIVCRVEASDGTVWANDEDAADWQQWIDYFNGLEDFDRDWFSKVSQPAFEPCVTQALARA